MCCFVFFGLNNRLVDCASLTSFRLPTVKSIVSLVREIEVLQPSNDMRPHCGTWHFRLAEQLLFMFIHFDWSSRNLFLLSENWLPVRFFSRSRRETTPATLIGLVAPVLKLILIRTQCILAQLAELYSYNLVKCVCLDVNQGGRPIYTNEP